MSNYPPEINKTKFLITERSCNYILRPVQVRKENYPYSYVVENLGHQVNVTVNRPWTYSNHLVLDFIGHEMYEKAYQTVMKYRTKVISMLAPIPCLNSNALGRWKSNCMKKLRTQD